jgi:IS30 family transposase
MLRARPPRLDRRRQGSADWLIERLFHAVVGVIEPPLQKVSALHDGEVHRLTVKPRVVRKLVVGSALFLEVVAHLRRGLSPEQIAFTLGSMDEPVRLSHETIYTALYAMPRGQLRARILTLLRRAHQHRRLRSAGKDRGKCFPNMTLIDDRPIEVEERLVPCHWEGDLIKGKRGQS